VITEALIGPTSTSTITVSSGGVSRGEVGGIAAGITGGFLLLGALAFFWISRNRTVVAGSPQEAYELDTRVARWNKRNVAQEQGLSETGGRLSTMS
jgi:hypothetical protein